MRGGRRGQKERREGEDGEEGGGRAGGCAGDGHSIQVDVDRRVSDALPLDQGYKYSILWKVYFT